jgi:hypothetical protein
MVFFGKHKGYGDKHNVSLDVNFSSRADFIERGAAMVRKIMDAAVVVPVHLYSHSGESISTSYTYPYNCQWDSGTCGFAVVTKEAIRKEYNVKRVTKDLIEKATKILEGEVKTLDQYISGEVYSFTIENKNGDPMDSCGGFYGGDYETNGMLEHFPEELIKELKEK